MWAGRDKAGACRHGDLSRALLCGKNRLLLARAVVCGLSRRSFVALSSLVLQIAPKMCTLAHIFGSVVLSAFIMLSVVKRGFGN